MLSNEKLKVGSLFSGIGGFDLGLEMAGMEVLWQVEQDKDCLKVLSRHFPGVERYHDVKEVGKSNLAAVDLICGGFPCQDLSVAGKRKGLDGERSGLWFEFARIIDELEPAFVLIENVPGLISSNSGNDIRGILDWLEDHQYVVDINILDSQDYRVAQRRRRVFILCEKVNHIIEARTISSSLTILQCLIEILGCILVEAHALYPIGHKTSTSLKSLSSDGLKRRMKLFGIAKEDFLKRLQQNLEDVLRRFPQGPEELEEKFRGPEPTDINLLLMDMLSGNLLNKQLIQKPGWSIGLSWKTTLAVISKVAKWSITSTERKRITTSTIYICAGILLNIGEFICQSNACCPNFWSAATSYLTMTQEYTNYARQANRDLFGDMEWVQPWADCHDRLATMRKSVSDIRVSSCGKILPILESSTGDTPKGRETGEEIAGSLGSGSTDSRRGWRGDLDTMGAYITPTLRGGSPGGSTHGKPSGTGRCDFESETFIAHQVQWASGGGQVLNDTAQSLRSGAEHNYQFVQTPMLVRRLTPTECERLQAFPDGHTAWGIDPQGKRVEISDSARYRCLGNAVTVSVIKFIAERIIKVHYGSA